jgi:hypothetical protein
MDGKEIIEGLAMKKVILLNSNAKEQELANLKTKLSNSRQFGSLVALANAGQLKSEVNDSLEDQIIIADGRLIDSPEQLLQALDANCTSDFTIIQPAVNTNEVSYESVSTENLIQFILHSSSLFFLAVSATKDALLANSEMENINSNEALARLAISATAQSHSVSIANGIISFAKELPVDSTLTNSQKANLLSYAISSANIEDLFPNYAWKDHEQESAAACFHTLAAHFIRLNDYKSAEECLSMSDQLEDSPRSLALRAMICKEQGQTLGAVANLVSSLQQYEDRKRNNENKHYFTFVPNDLEKINTNLQEGLSALNQQENDKAFGYFKNAVFNFDNFFQETGLDD